MIQDNGINLEKVYLVNNLKEEIKRVNKILRETKNPHELRQNKKYLERLERKEPNMGIDEYYEILTQGGICEDETCTLKDYMDILIRSQRSYKKTECIVVISWEYTLRKGNNDHERKNVISNCAGI